MFLGEFSDFNVGVFLVQLRMIKVRAYRNKGAEAPMLNIEKTKLFIFRLTP
jgi:hypothetical protein